MRWMHSGSLGTGGRKRVRLRDETFDDLTRAAGGCSTRRGALKLLIATMAGALVGPEVLTACDNDRSPKRQRESACPPGPRQLVCCTGHERKACQKVGERAALARAPACRPVCSGNQKPPIAACKACADTVAHQVVAAHDACVASTCMSLPHSGASSAAAASVSTLAFTESQPNPLNRAQLMDAIPCNYAGDQACFESAQADAAACEAGVLIGCLASGPGYAACVAVGTVGCLAAYEIKVAVCIQQSKCAFGTLCTPQGVCCNLTHTGCVGSLGSDCCLVTATCCNGQCCPAGTGLSCCPTGCVNLQDDNENCGSCGNACPTGGTCINGQCGCIIVTGPLAGRFLAPASSQTGTICNGQCVDTQTDPSNCGACGNVCPSGELCVGGACGCGGTSCGPPNTCCNNQCVDTQTDPNNCGTCGNVCSAGATCQNGQCSGCAGGETMCSGVCVDTQSDPSNCGSCGNSCPSGVVCQNGQCNGTCEPPCAPGLSCCVYELGCESGCCVDLLRDTQNCGACQNACQPGQVCFNGECGCGPCEPGKICCPGCIVSSGSVYCCVDPMSDNSNCGGCGIQCAKNELCCDGQCIPCASAPFAFCCNGQCCRDAPPGTPQYCCGGQCCYGDCRNGKCCPFGVFCNDGECCTQTYGCCGDVCCPYGCSPDATCCPSEQPTGCLSGCADTQTNPNNCGTCGNACGPGLQCVGGKCT
jgi:hypothetical protein